MRKLKEAGYMEQDLFDIFIDKGVYREYAQLFLDPWQNDDIGA